MVDVCTRWRGTALHLGLQLKLIWLSLVMGYSVDIFTTSTKRILWEYNLDFIAYIYIYMYVCVCVCDQQYDMIWVCLENAYSNGHQIHQITGMVIDHWMVPG